MTDQQLLEAAAKAAGLAVESWIAWGGAWAYHREAPANEEGEFPIFRWDPLEDDGDAFRLAVKLRMDVVQFTIAVRVSAPQLPDDYYLAHDADPLAATRRAVVRAAAAMAQGEQP